MSIEHTDTICGANCSECFFKDSCKGCAQTGGRPFGGTCVAVSCCQRSNLEKCAECSASHACDYKAKLIAECNSLGIKNMPQVTELYLLPGSYVNLEYELPGGQKIRFWKDENIYFCAQLHKTGSERCYGITADDNYLLVCEYGENGSDPEIVVFKRR